MPHFHFETSAISIFWQSFLWQTTQAPAGTVRDHCDLIVGNVLRISLDAKPQIKAELYGLVKKLMLRCGPEKIGQV